MPTDAPTDSDSNLPEFTVTELSGAVKRTIEGAFERVRVRGELGRVVVARSGHMYADLKDEKSVLAGVMWKGSAGKLAFKPEEGLEVVAEGRLTTFPGQSKYQLVIERLEPAGVGALMAMLEERKKKLAAEGLFAKERKKPIPFLPEVIGVVTSPTGAVIRDILHRLADRFPRHVLVWPVLVQGDKAAEQVAAAVAGFNKISGTRGVPRPDVLIVARGGGSIEDLWAFNEEVVARAVAASAIPVISAVGHETDVTLIDYVADRRAPTPTGAAEMAVPVRADLALRVDQLGGRLRSNLARTVEAKHAGLTAAARGLPKPADILGRLAQRLDQASLGLRAGLKGLADRAAIRFGRVSGRLRREALLRDIAQRRLRVGEQGPRLRSAGARGLRDRGRALEGLSLRLESLNPKAVLGRGYALVRDAEGGLVRAAKGLSAGDRVGLEFADGGVDAVVGKSAGAGGGSKGASAPNKRQERLF